MGVWEWNLPTRVIFGVNARDRLPELIGKKPAALIRSKSAGAVPGVFTGEFGGIRPNPTKENVAECAAFIKAQKAELVVALGGGSVLDCAKAAVGILTKTAGRLPIIALPTTAGTGSEVTDIAVVSDGETGVKRPEARPEYFPAVALVDPELTYSVPRKVAAESGMDALSHAVEALWSLRRNPAGDALALRAARVILDNLESACAGEKEAKNAVSEGSLLAGLAFSQSKTAGSHACSFYLTSEYGMSHGAACAFTLAAFTRLNGFDVNARALGFADAKAFADEIDRLKRALGLPVTLKDAGIPQKALPAVAAAALLPANMKNNPVLMDEAAMLRLLQSLS